MSDVSDVYQYTVTATPKKPSTRRRMEWSDFADETNAILRGKRYDPKHWDVAIETFHRVSKESLEDTIKRRVRQKILRQAGGEADAR